MNLSEYGYFDKLGLVVTREGEDVAENAFMFTNIAIILKRKLGLRVTGSSNLQMQIDKCRTESGVYNPHPRYKELQPKDQHMSHDTLTGVLSFSKIHNLNMHKDIWNEIKRQNFRYDTENPHKPSSSRFLHPRDIIFAGMCAGSPIATLCSPILSLICLASILKTWKIRPNGKFLHTDGKILAFQRYEALKSNFIINLTYKISTAIIQKRKEFGSWAKVFETYFHAPNHVIPELARRVGI